MSKQYHFRCLTNPNAPILTLSSGWEAKEMRDHPDYEEIDETGEAVKRDDDLEGTIPFAGSQGRR